MADIYGNAFLTIAAASARSVHEGIFFDRKHTAQQVAIKFSSEHGDAQDNQVYIQYKPKFRDCVDEPLYHRGWTLQERMLSPRVVAFTRDQLVWNCQTQNMTESGVAMNALGQQRLRISDVFHDGGALIFWHSVVRDYSCRCLTNATDKLPALSGLAAALHQLTGDEYLAGLWKGSLLDDLLWVNEAPYGGGGNKVAPSRQPDCSAPSWSWASVDGNINFHRSSKASAFYFAQCLSYHITLSGIDEYGAVSDGWIKLRGPLVQVLKLGLERGSKLIVPSEGTHNPSPVALGNTKLDAGETDIAISNLNPNSELSDIWVLRIKKKAGLVLRAIDDGDSLDETEDSDGLSTTDGSGIWAVGAATYSGVRDSSESPANGIVQRVRNIFRHLPWNRSKPTIAPPIPKPLPPKKPPIPKRFRRLGMIELDLIGMERFEHCIKRTVTII
ncbi:hypothetical protein BKA66DRAFT_479674 [Pyrenochaeta sp. MPI-SDFR-AT-0127]|nr:hypothetical protein BKA66DRAFT_479674 [Pyrenochaeta sp. MPI-SDFR-AT-0127]